MEGEITNKLLNGRERSDIYMTHVCRLPRNMERLEHFDIKKIEIKIRMSFNYE